MKTLLYDLNYLKSQIIPLPFKLCNKSSKFNYLKNIRFPKSYYQDLQFLCEQYDATFQINITEKEDDAYSYYDFNIYKTPHSIINLTVSKEKPIITRKDICTLFTHELAHHIQNMVCQQNNISCECPTFNSALKYERIAERLAYFIYKQYFTHFCPSITHRNFNAYLSKNHIEFLKNFRKKYGKY